MLKPCLTLAVTLFASVTAAGEPSVIELQLSAPLAGLSTLAEQALPTTLHQPGERAMRCVEPKRACTKVPEFRGLKVTMNNRCVDVSPAIDCSIDERVWRDGPMSVSGSGGTITVTQTVRARATVRGRGELGRHIRETVNGAATFTISAAPRIARDWSVSMPPPAVDFRFTERPNVMLFNVIRITFGSEAANALRKSIDSFRIERLPGLLAEIDLRGEMVSLWSEIQRPVRLPVGEGPPLWLHMQPKRIGLDPIRVEGGMIQTRAALTARTTVTGSRASPFGAKTSLPGLSTIPAGGLRLVIPVLLSPKTLTGALAAEAPFELASDEFAGGRLEIRQPIFSIRSERIEIAATARVSLFGLDYEGPLTISGKPNWDATSQTLVFDDPLLRIEQPGIGPATLNAIARSAPVRSGLARMLRASLAEEIASTGRRLNAALKLRFAPGAQMETDLDLAIADLDVRDGGLALILRATGSARLSLEILE